MSPRDFDPGGSRVHGAIILGLLAVGFVLGSDMFIAGFMAAVFWIGLRSVVSGRG